MFKATTPEESPLLLHGMNENRPPARQPARAALILSTLIALAARPPFLFGDDLERLGPKLAPPPAVADSSSAAEGAALPAASAKPLVDQLKSIVLVSRPEMVARKGIVARTPALKAPRSSGVTQLPPLAQGPATEAGGITNVQLRGVTPPAPDVFAKEIGKPYLGKPISRQSINTLIRDITLYYRRHNRPVVKVILPEQEITNGVLQLIVVEGRVGEVRVEGNRWFSGERLERQVGLRSGEPIDESRVLADIDWLNTNPFREVSVAYAPGKDYGATDVVVKVNDRFPMRVYAGYEDSGNEITGRDRWLTGFDWGNAFGLDHQLSYEFAGSNDFEGLRAHTVIYTAPLPWRNTLSVFATYSDSIAESPIVGEPFHAGGRSWQASFRYTAPLPQIGALAFDVFAGADFKQSNNDLQFGGAQIYRSDVDIAQIVGGCEARQKDAWGSTSFTGTAYYSPGGVTANNSDAVFQQARAYSSADYIYSRVNLERINNLPADCSLRLRAGAQWSDRNLQASEQLGLGGYDTVRGYDEWEARGDSGYLLSAELRSPSVSLLHIGAVGKEAADHGRVNDQLQVLAFVDYGSTDVHDPLPGEPRTFELFSAGPGLRYAITSCFSVRFDYGWRLKDDDLLQGHGGVAHLSVFLSY